MNGLTQRSRLDALPLQQWSRWMTLLGVACIACLVPFWLRMVVSPAPQEMREGALLWSTRALLEFRNPYAFETLPGPANLYGPLYPLLVVPWAWLFGPTLFTHRLVNGIGITIACFLIYRTLRAFDATRPTALAGAAINLAGLLYWVGPTARPDGVGIALLIAAYATMAPNPASPKRFALGLLLSLAGLATKVYYVLPVVSAVAWIGVRRGPTMGLKAGAVAACATAMTMIGLATMYPAWPSIVLGANLHATTYDVGHLVRQSLDWTLFSLPLIVAAVIAWRPWQRAMDLWTVALLVGLAAVLLVLGGHRGAHMTYFFHVVTPPLTIVALREADRRLLARVAMSLALLVAVAINAHWFTFDLDRMARAESTFDRLARAIDAAVRPTGTSEVAPLLLAAGRDPIETGHTEYFHNRRLPAYLAPLWGETERFETAVRLFERRFYSAIHNGAFDLVISNRLALDRITPDALAVRYRPVEHLVIDLPWAQQSWPVEIWRRQPNED
ncbi:MAG: hypothetical protein FJW27_01100 [Acidimicrobiia bacterium]|nr:hypothetical protein [Acidimicrobiia bacterium]